jgi:hypothetical protein
MALPHGFVEGADRIDVDRDVARGIERLLQY